MREATHPADAIPIYLSIADEILVTADGGAYSKAIRILKRARAAAVAAEDADQFAEMLAKLREQHRRRPSLIAMLDKAGLTGQAERDDRPGDARTAGADRRRRNARHPRDRHRAAH